MKPKYIAIAAVSVDGKIAKHQNHPSDWTSKEDKKFMREILDSCDAIIVGNNTYQTALRPLAKRNCIVLSRKQAGRRGKNLFYCNPQKVSLRRLIGSLGYKRVAILGGARTYAYFLEHNLLDEIYLTLEPVVFGQGINLFAAKKFSLRHFRLVWVKKLNAQGSLLLKYRKF